MWLTSGPSRAGKSSFINTIGRKNVTQVGTSNNESTTDLVNPFPVDLTSLPRNPTSLTIFDVPGSDDSKMRMTNSEIKTKIEESVLSISKTDKLSAILVFESLSEKSHLRKTISDLEFMLGPEYKKSTIVVLTKEDNFVYQEDRVGAKQTAEGICRDFNLPFIYIKNNHGNIRLTDAEYNEQFDLLMDMVKSLSPYLLKEVQYYQNKIVERAKYLQLTLPKNKTTVQIELEVEKIRSEEVPVQKSRIRYDVNEKRRGGVAGLFGGRKSVVTSSTEYYTENETRYFTETVTETRDQEMELEYDFSYYMNLAKEEVLKEIRSRMAEIK